MLKILNRILRGEGSVKDLDLLISVANNIEGNTICALGDAACAARKIHGDEIQRLLRTKSEEGN